MVPGSVSQDLNRLTWVSDWAVKWRTPQGQYLMRENAVWGSNVQTEKNPRRPVGTEDHYQTTRAKTDQVTMEVRWHGGPKTVRSGRQNTKMRSFRARQRAHSKTDFRAPSPQSRLIPTLSYAGVGGSELTTPFFLVRTAPLWYPCVPAGVPIRARSRGKARSTRDLNPLPNVYKPTTR
jgi:hypothetical protein